MIYMSPIQRQSVYWLDFRDTVRWRAYGIVARWPWTWRDLELNLFLPSVGTWLVSAWLVLVRWNIFTPGSWEESEQRARGRRIRAQLHHKVQKCWCLQTFILCYQKILSALSKVDVGRGVRGTSTGKPWHLNKYLTLSGYVVTSSNGCNHRNCIIYQNCKRLRNRPDVGLIPPFSNFNGIQGLRDREMTARDKTVLLHTKNNQHNVG